jgi:AcrR family transcriptional regulator
MSSLESQVPTRRRDDRRERTRERLLSAAVEVLRREGLGALNVSRVAKDVGVHPSLFYAHFKNLDACVAAAAERVLQTLAPVDRELRRDLFRRAVTDRRELARFFLGAFDRWLEQRPFVELLLAHRLDRSPMGEVLRPALAAIREEMTAELWDLSAQLRIDGKHIREAQALADLHLSHWLWALEMLIEGRAHDRVALASTLAGIFLASNIAFFAHASGPTHDEVVAATLSAERQGVLTHYRHQLRQRVETRTDARLIADSGGSEALVQAVLEGLLPYFLPSATRGVTASVLYRVDCPELLVERYVLVRDDQCTIEREPSGGPPRMTVSLSLRTFLETISGCRHFDQAYRQRQIQVDGDLFFAVTFIEWFYRP